HTTLSVAVGGCSLYSLTITPVNCVNFTLTAPATVADRNGYTTLLRSTELVTVNPEAATVSWAAATPGTEGTAIPLGTLAATANSLAGDSNTPPALVVSAIPVGDTLSDGHGHTFTATATTTSGDVSG